LEDADPAAILCLAFTFFPVDLFRAPRLFTRARETRNAVMIDQLVRPLSALVFLVPLAGCGGESSQAAPPAPPVLRFTGIPNENTTELKAKYQPLADHLSRELGVPVEYVPVADYTASVDAFKSGDILLCWFGGFTGLQARQLVPGARVIACGRIDKEFHSYFVANRSLGIEASDSFPKVLAGQKFTFGSPSSTSGRLMPEFFIRKETGLSPAEFFGMEMSFSGSHDKTAKLVEAGTFDAGAMDYATYDRMVKEQKLDPEVCHIVWTTPDYVDYNFTVHPRLEAQYGAGFTEKLQKVLVAIQDPVLLAGMNRPEGLVPATNADFDSLSAAALDAGLLR
jgi:phosphonate transport system substrate-binding protein